MWINSLINVEVSDKNDQAEGALFDLSSYLSSGRIFMTESHMRCRYPGDVEGCAACFILAWKEGRLEKYCIMEGLRKNNSQCRQIFKDGLYCHKKHTGDQAGKGAGVHLQWNELHKACKELIRVGFPSDTGAMRKALLESYAGLIHTCIRRFNLKPHTTPSSDDVFNDVYISLLKLFLKGDSAEPIRERLATYISRVTINACLKEIEKAHRYVSLEDDAL